MKRRLAYSTMSNLSYVLLGALMLTPEGLQGGLLHMVYHAIMKICLFSCVGAMMIRTGKSYVGEMRGMSRVMPFTMAVFLFCGIELVGIPPFVGFQSKWALATAALSANGALGRGGRRGSDRLGGAHLHLYARSCGVGLRDAAQPGFGLEGKSWTPAGACSCR